MDCTRTKRGSSDESSGDVYRLKLNHSCLLRINFVNSSGVTAIQSTHSTFFNGVSKQPTTSFPSLFL